MIVVQRERRRSPAPKLRRAVVCFVLLCCSLSLKAQPAPQSVVLGTCYLNADCIPDTVKGHSTGLRTYLPDVIIWGKPAAHSSCPDIVQGRHSPGTPFVPLTPLLYSGWTEQSGSVALQRYNQNDSLDDIILYLWGKYQNAQGQWRDTARAVVIFGQKDLDMQHLIIVQDIAANFQTSPFFAMDLRFGHELVDPDERDLTGEISCELLPANVQVSPGNEPPHPVVTFDTVVTDVRVYPNPTDLWARMQAEPLAPGEYTISIMAVSGEEYHKQTVQIGEGGHLERELDLRTLPSGYYVIRLHTNGRYVGSYPITIVR